MKNIIILVTMSIFVSCSQRDKTQNQVYKTEFDLVILQGRVMDPESGLDSIKNIGIIDGTIHTITDSLLEGNEIIQASGLIVAPGFIDTDSYPSNAELQIKDGVTTVLNLRSGTGDINDWYSEYRDKTPVNLGLLDSHKP